MVRRISRLRKHVFFFLLRVPTAVMVKTNNTPIRAV